MEKILMGNINFLKLLSQTSYIAVKMTTESSLDYIKNFKPTLQKLHLFQGLF